MAFRYYYKTECVSQISTDIEKTGACTEMVLKNKKLIAPFAAKFIFLVLDTRY